jgi:ribosomal protein S18 acetylase RimI-like enzyme
MWRREDELIGPDAATPDDIEAINRVFSDAFTERYHRDGMNGVRVPLLSPAIWRFAIATAADGALVWRDRSGTIAAFNMVHVSGAEGWMGPLAVRPDCQGRGVGRTIVTVGSALLRERGCRVIGLETMPRTIENIGFYSTLGFRPAFLTISMVNEASRRGDRPPLASESRQVDWLGACTGLTARLAPGLDFHREMALTLEQTLGDVSLVWRDGGLAGYALWHSAALAAGRPADELRVLKLSALDPAAFRSLVEGLLTEARARSLRRVAIRCQTANRAAFAELLALGFRVHWTDLRMTLEGFDEAPAPAGVVFSNWEI